VLRIDPEVIQDFDGSTVEPLDGVLGVVRPEHQLLEDMTPGTTPRAREAGADAVLIRDGGAARTGLAPSTEEIVDNPPLEAQG
jgi:hypothetical protein